jgi:hypothetical protein
MKMKKSIMAILGTAVIVLSLLAPVMIRTGVAADPSAWYKTVNGVLDTDTYALYPFATDASLKIGFSQYGEFINELDNVGLEYRAVDPFAPPAGGAIGSIVKSAWLNGWLCNITYYHTIRSEQRVVWVSAQSGDPMGVTYGGPWLRVDYAADHDATYGQEDPRGPGYIIGNYAAGGNNWGGRKTNGTAVTDPIAVLYDGPRLYVARLKTTIYDHFLYLSDDNREDTPLVEVRFTVLFDKVKKEVVVFKELKTLVPDKYADELKVQFSNRGEVDLGTEAEGYTSYFHFYTEGTSRGLNWEDTGKNYENNDTSAEGLDTVYDRDWVMNQTENPVTSSYYNFSTAGPYPQTSGATYDVATAINPDAGYVWWAAFWPSLSDWTIDGWPMWWRSMQATDAHDIDSRTWELHPRLEPTIPFYIGEWDVVLKPVAKKTPLGYPDMQQYRFVTVYGVTDLNDASDANMPGKRSNTPDSETMYLLNEYFNPWDLHQAIDKKSERWVDFKYHDGVTTGWITNRRPVMDVSTSMWDQYNQFSERVIDLNTSELLYRRNGDYTFYVDAYGYGRIGGLLPNHDYKILYSTDTYYESDTTWDPTLEIEDLNGTIGQTATKYFDYSDYSIGIPWTDPTGVSHDVYTDYYSQEGLYFSFTNKTGHAFTEDMTFTYDSPWIEWETEPFKVFKEDTTYLESGTYGFAPENVTIANQGSGTLEFQLYSIELGWDITGPQGPLFTDLKDVHFISFNPDFRLHVDVFYNATSQFYTVTTTLEFESDSEGQPIYAYYTPGRYEWGIVGRNAASVDSAGLSNVAAAFKNKQVEYGLAGEDIYDPVIANQMPCVMSPIRAGTSWASYYYGTTDFRVALADDWSSQDSIDGNEVPVSSSNMIGVGGPLANMLAYYGNDFMDALFGLSQGLSQFTSYAAWQNQIVPLTCWNLQSDANTYASNNTIGYGVISTYQDLNGTVLFLIWGHWGRDTYYLTKWFHDYGIMQLQDVPSGVTSIVVKIDYESTSAGYKPTDYTIVEVLGTISERHWWHNSEHKGGIHDP